MSHSGPISSLLQLAELAETTYNMQSPKDHFVQQVVSAVKAKDTASLKELSKQWYLLTEDNSKKNALVHLFLEGDPVAATFLANYLKIDNAQMAEHAAQAGKKALVTSYLNTIEPQKRDYVRLAAKAACGGHLELAEYYLGDNHSAIHWVIEEAAYAGHKTIVEHFFVKLPVNEQNYDFIARCAEQGNHPALANYFRQKQKSLSAVTIFKMPLPISRKATQMPPPFYNKPDPIEPPLPQPLSVTFPPLPALWFDQQPPLLYQFGLPSLLQAHHTQDSDQAPQTRTKSNLFPPH